MNLKNSIKESMTFSRKERIGVIILIPAILIIALLPFIRPSSQATSLSAADSLWLASAAGLQEPSSGPGGREIKDAPGENSANDPRGDFPTPDNHAPQESLTGGILFRFDPNTLDAGGFKKLGLREKTIRTLLNYRNKGGKFRKPDDLARIYGLKPEEFHRLKPYINIVNGERPGIYHNPVNAYSTEGAAGHKALASKPRYSPKIIDINTADISGFESLYGIGSKLAARIINFREKLGGFYSVSQVGETYGVADSTFQRIKSQLQANTALVKKININKATYDELNNHPYISAKTASHIMKWRKENGHFTGIEPVKELLQGTDSFEKIAPYLAVD